MVLRITTFFIFDTTSQQKSKKKIFTKKENFHKPQLRVEAQDLLSHQTSRKSTRMFEEYF